jgi:hypothetical protein
LQDLGFTLLPELGQNNEWVSETIFNTMLASFLIWTFSPFWQESGKRFYTAVLYARVLVVLVSKPSPPDCSQIAGQIDGGSFPGFPQLLAC